MVSFHVIQTTDTEWEIRTDDNQEVVATVTETGPTSAEGSCGMKPFRGLKPGNVIGQIFDHIRSKPQPPMLEDVVDIVKDTLNQITDSPTDAFAPQQSKVFPRKNKERKEQ